eukprot:COSAG06_NODE_31852_length_514_cov_15.455422_1_plen_78_part_01
MGAALATAGTYSVLCTLYYIYYLIIALQCALSLPVPCCFCGKGELCAVLCCAVLCCAVLCCAVLCCAVLCCAVLCYAT